MFFWGFTGAMLYQLNYEACWEQVKSEFNLYPLYEESEMLSEFDVRISSEFSMQLL